MRQVEIHLSAEQVAGAEAGQAIGYLATWALERFPLVLIYPDGGRNIVASYCSKDGQRGYLIGAVWREGANEYSFHS